MDEMHHAEWLIEQILFFERALTVSKLNLMKIGKTVSEMIGNTIMLNFMPYMLTTMQSNLTARLMIKVLLIYWPKYLKWKKTMLIGLKYNV